MYNIIVMLPQFGQPPKGEHLIKIKQSKNYGEHSFVNWDNIKMEMGVSKMPNMFKQQFKRGVEKQPKKPRPILKRNPDEFALKNDTLVRLTWFGHSSFLIELEGAKILLDPMLGPAASPFSFAVKRFNKELPLTAEQLPPIDAVILSHDHYDHLDYQTILDIKDKVGCFYTPLGVGSHLKKWGVAEQNIVELDWWDEVSFGHVNLTCTPSQHFSGRAGNDRDKTLWSSWSIKTDKTSIFFTGDSGYFKGWKEIGDKLGPFDICLTECGQYNVLWKENHMMPEESLQAFLDLKGGILVPIHWGAFSLSPHAWDEPIERIKKAAANKDVIVATPQIGESIILGEALPNTEWWK